MNKLQIVKAHFSDNGFQWTCYFVFHGLIKRISKSLSNRMNTLEMKHKLPGDNTITRNFRGWREYDWSELGENWTVSSEWKQSLIDEVLLRYIGSGKTVLEIGPGGGRWTETLQKTAKRLIVVDLSDKCIEICRKRFAGCDNIEYFVNNGTSLNSLQDESVDYIWSFDVFVHINAWDTKKYLEEFSRVLRKGGQAVIHHPSAGRPTLSEDDGFRSNTTSELFCSMLKECGLKLVNQFDSWGDHGQFDVKSYHDIITVFSK